MTTKPYEWIETVTDALAETGQIPLWGQIPPFPWKECSNHLKSKFGSEELSLSLDRVVPRPSDQLLEGMGADPYITPINATPLEETLFWAMSQEDVARLTSLLATQSKPETGFCDERFVKGFYSYLSLEVLETLHSLNPFKDLTLTLSEPKDLPEITALCVDVKIHIEGVPLWGRIICPPSFQGTFKQHFANERFDITPSSFSSALDIELTLTAGDVTLNFQEWEGVSVGDFILLDRGLFDPNHNKGTLDMTLGTTPLFQARLKEGTLKILDYAYFSEEEEYMDELPPDPKEEHPEETPEPTKAEEQAIPDEEAGSAEEEMGSAEEEPEHLWSEEEGVTPLKEIIKTSEVPVTLTVEVSKLNMSLNKLLELEPGNTLELKTRPEDGVSITMKGKCVAHAELIKIGDALGIKILKLGR